MNTKLKRIREQLIFTIHEDMPITLSTGKMGICLYFYIVSQYEKDKKLSKIGDDMLKSVYERIGELKSINIANGLSGIGLGIDYLSKHKYLKGNINNALADVDNEIFKKIFDTKYFSQLESSDIIQVLYYLHARLDNRGLDKESDYLLKELTIYLVNKLYDKVDLHSMDEPFNYNIDYKLPQYLYILGKIYSLGFYNNRIEKMIDESKYKILSTIPNLHSNKLYLLWGINSLGKQLLDENMQKHMLLLKRETDLQIIFDKELNEGIYFYDGLSSIYKWLVSLQQTFSQTDLLQYRTRIAECIAKSNVWDLLMLDMSYLKNHRGLINGFTGVHLLLIDMNYN